MKNHLQRLICIIMVMGGTCVMAEPKEQLYGDGSAVQFEAGWPMRVNPPNRLAAFNGQALRAIYANKPVWIAPSDTPAELPTAAVKFGYFHDPSDLLKKHSIMAIALGKDGKIVYERYQFGTTSQFLNPLLNMFLPR